LDEQGVMLVALLPKLMRIEAGRVGILAERLFVAELTIPINLNSDLFDTTFNFENFHFSSPVITVYLPIFENSSINTPYCSISSLA
jgi:hypothetical protein